MKKDHYCERCQTLMFRSSHTEQERIGTFVLMTGVHHIECPLCGVTHITIVPGLTPQQLENH